MMSKQVKWQLTIFAIITVIGLTAMSVVYLKLPQRFGFDRVDVALEMPVTGGLYQNANVSYLGNTVGTVEEVNLNPEGVRANLYVEDSANLPENVRAEIRSVSAVGEQYVDLIPVGAPEGELESGTVLRGDQVSLPQGMGPVLDQATALLASVNNEKMRNVLQESFDAFAGSEQDLQRLIDSTRLFVQEANNNSEAVNALIQDAEPLLDSQIRSEDSLKKWIANLANVTDQLRENRPQLESILDNGPEMLAKTQRTMDELQPVLPVLVANLMSVGEVGVVYNRSLEQLFVLYPAIVSALLTAIDGGKDADSIKVDFNLQLNSPPPCTTGFIPAADQRSPADLSVPAQINGLYCKVPSDADTTVRGARNLPCMEFPGRRGASVQQCREGGYGPQDVLGDNPPDNSEVGPPQTDLPDLGLQDWPAGGEDPNTYATTAAMYDPDTGEYVASDGKTYSQTDLGKNTALASGASMTDAVLNGVKVS